MFGVFPKIKPRTDRGVMLAAVQRIERLANSQSKALAVVLGSQGNRGTQADLNQIACDAREIARLLAVEDIDKEQWPPFNTEKVG